MRTGSSPLARGLQGRHGVPGQRPVGAGVAAGAAGRRGGGLGVHPGVPFGWWSVFLADRYKCTPGVSMSQGDGAVGECVLRLILSWG